jgi:hypothetical protein
VSTRARLVALHVVVALVACGQAICVLELLGARLPHEILVVEAIIVAVAAAAALRRPSEPDDLARWGAIGFGMWAVWGAVYFGAAALTPASSAHTLDDPILARLPLVPAFTAVYLGVHVVSVVPYCALRETRLLRRYLLGNIVLVLVAAVAWVAWPVRLDRPPLPAGDPRFGMWLLRYVHTADPTTNCLPSAHCGVAVYAAIMLRAASRRLFVWGVATAAAICVSTVFTKQHYLADVAVGSALAALVALAVRYSARRG